MLYRPIIIYQTVTYIIRFQTVETGKRQTKDGRLLKKGHQKFSA